MRSSPSGSPPSRSPPRAAVRTWTRDRAASTPSPRTRRRAAEGLLASLDASSSPHAGRAPTSTSAVASSRAGPALLYIALLVPFLLCLADLVARLRRWHVPFALRFAAISGDLASGLSSALCSRSWGWRSMARRGRAAINPASGQATGHGLPWRSFSSLSSPMARRTRLARAGKPVAPEDEVAGMAVALGALAVVSLVLIATRPSACCSCCPPPTPGCGSQARNRGPLLRTCLYVIGLAGPLLVIGSTALRFGLGARRALVPC